MMGPAKEVTEAYGLFVHAAAMGLPDTSVKLGQADPDPQPPSPGEIASDPATAEEALPEVQLGGSAFGTGLAQIIDVSLTNAEGRRLGVVQGGQDVWLNISARAARRCPASS